MNFIVARVESKYSEGRRYAHLYDECPAVHRAVERGGIRRIARAGDRVLCGVCSNWQKARQRPTRTAADDFYIRADGDGLWMTCPELCGWQEWADGGEPIRRLRELARRHLREARAAGHA